MNLSEFNNSMMSMGRNNRGGGGRNGSGRRDGTGNGSGRGRNASSTCEYLELNGVSFKKTLRSDGTGADFKLKDVETAKKAFAELSKHSKIRQRFDVEWDDESTIVKIFFKE